MELPKHMNMLKGSLNCFLKRQSSGIKFMFESHSTVEPFIAEEIDVLFNFIVAL